MVSIESKPENSRQVLVVRGEIDMESSPAVMDAIREAVREARPLSIDLSGVDYIDSAGIAVLIQGLKSARKTNVEYRLRNPSSRVMSVVSLSQLEGFFEYDNTGAEE